jgi:hypothetical protein
MPTICKHPFNHAGAGRTDRLLKALMPSNVALDNRELADLMVFAAKFGKVINYWDWQKGADKSKDTLVQNGDWSCFWESDYLFFLATVAAANTEGSENAFKILEETLLDGYERKPVTLDIKESNAHNFFALIKAIRHIAVDIASFGQNAERFPALQQDISTIIQNTLQQPLRSLMAYAKGLKEPTDFGAFIPTQNQHPFAKEWAVTQFDFEQNIDFIDPTVDYMASWQALKRIFRRFVMAQERIRKQADKYLKTAQNDPNRRQHAPHIVLFVSFLHLFKHLQDQLNALPQKHLDYYYNDILHLQNRKEIPDQAHLVFQLALNVYQQTLPIGTAFRAGKTPDGKDMFYTLERPLTLNQGQVVELKTLLSPNTEGSSVPAANWERTILDTDKKTDIPKKMKEILPFRPLGEAREPSKKAMVGFAIGSPMIPTTKSNRMLVFDFKSDAFMNVVKFLKTEISSKDAWIKAKTPVAFAKLNGLENTQEIVVTGFALSATAIAFVSPKNDPIFVTPNLIKDNKSLFDLKTPAVRFFIDDKTNEEKVDKTAYETAYKDLSTITLSGITATLNVDDLTDFGIYEGSINRPLGHTQNIDLTSAARQGGLIVRCDEAFKKGLTTLTFKLDVKSPLTSGTALISTVSLFINGKIRVAGKTVSGQSSFGINWDNARGTISFTEIQKALIGDEINLAQLDAYIKIDLGYVRPTITLKAVVLKTDGSVDTPALTKLQEFDSPVFADANIEYTITRELSSDLENPEFFHLSSHGGHAAKDPKDSTFFPPFPNPEPVFEVEKAVYTEGSSKVAAAANAEIAAQKASNTEGSFEPAAVEQPRGVTAGGDQIGTTVKPPPTPLYRGNLLIGVKEAPKRGILSLLFQVEDGTETDLESFPPDIDWSYLSKNDWKRFPSGNIVFDSTKADEGSKRSLVQSGVIEFQMPDDAKKGDSLLNPNYYWLRASATETTLPIPTTVGALPSIVGIFAQAGRVRLATSPIDARHFDAPLPPSTINQLRFRQAAVRLIEQPYAAFGGRANEQGAAYHLRISERLRHKRRAITAWDYEHLVLEQFPEVRFVKCINHSFPKDKDNFDTLRTGAVALVVMPFKTPNQLEPHANRSTLENIKGFLKKRCNGFTSGDDLLQVIPPQYQQIVVSLRVKFRAGDTEKHVHNLDNDIARLIAPWAFDLNIEPTFGNTLYRTTLLSQIEALDYVDYLEDFLIVNDEDINSISILVKKDAKDNPLPRKVLLKTDALKVENLKAFIAPNDARTLLTSHQLAQVTPFETNHIIKPLP